MASPASPSSERVAPASITLSPLSSASGSSVRASDVVVPESDNKNASDRLWLLLRAGGYDAAISGIWKSVGLVSCSWSVFILPAVREIAEGSKNASNVAKTTAVFKSVSGESPVKSAVSVELKSIAATVQKKEDGGIIDLVNAMMSKLKTLSEVASKADLERAKAVALAFPGATEIPEYLETVGKISELVTRYLQSSEKSHEAEIKAIRDAYEKRITDLRKPQVPAAAASGAASAGDESPVQLSPQHSPENSKIGRVSVSRHHSISVASPDDD
jgi:hypothetical protein